MSVPHSLPQDEALLRVRNLLTETRRLHGSEITDVSEEWKGSRCRFRLKMWVFTFSGTIDVGSESVDIRGRLPAGTGRYAERATAVIEQRLHLLLQPQPPRPPGPTIAGPPPSYRS